MKKLLIAALSVFAFNAFAGAFADANDDHHDKKEDPKKKKDDKKDDHHEHK